MSKVTINLKEKETIVLDPITGQTVKVIKSGTDINEIRKTVREVMKRK